MTIFLFSFCTETQSYVLNFHGRVTQASVKNFQIVHDNDGKTISSQSADVWRDCLKGFCMKRLS